MADTRGLKLEKNLAGARLVGRDVFEGKARGSASEHIPLVGFGNFGHS